MKKSIFGITCLFRNGVAMADEEGELVKILGLDRVLMFKFFAFFSRFEFALKRSGYLVKGTEKARADWDRYAKSIQGQFDQEKNETILEAIKFLNDNPPRTQVVNGSDLGWQETIKAAGEHPEAYILRLIRTVRNNLFHGGKFPESYIELDDEIRNESLVKSCLTLLEYCLKLNGGMRDLFFELP